ncbi:hypothetical protein FA95DRAFT_1560574 [Auriscalpium vulgare]|uniref:Uncharacterized protein n=1 Tax=Auriscalpium vulgare TaxID=40419 RepID=A0ACB8RQG6_9AGAM|nr:hypothetical protein FA95DRAFT_1560574 [Auriscalpium vulgare]
MGQREAESEAQLTVTRIVRLLRPLRNKCAALASCTASSSQLPKATVNRVNYGSRPALWNSDQTAPLNPLQDPTRLQSRALLDRHSRANLPLSIKIYAVVSAFTNILQAAFSAGACKSNKKMMDLTEICAAVVGRTIREEVVRNTISDEDQDESEDVEMAIIDELYEAVPTRFRRWTLVSHAVSVVLDMCPPDPTLLTRLLEVTLSYRLLSESATILRALLVFAVTPSKAHDISPISHVAHASFLTSLNDQWTSAADDQGVPAFPERSFVALVVEVLVEHGGADAWSCKAARRLAWPLRKRDFGGYLLIMDGLAKAACGNDVQLERLAKWLRPVSADFPFTSAQDRGTREEFFALLETLELARSLGLHTCPVDAEWDSSAVALQGILVCLATQCLASPLLSSGGANHTTGLLQTLCGFEPRTSTFDDIVNPMFLPQLSPLRVDSQPPPCPDIILRNLEAYASALRRHLMWPLEAALWTGALRNFERMEPPTTAAARAAATQLRRTLMDAVTQAECRLVATVPAEADDDDRWDWEDMVGCWVRRSPSRPKKRRIEAESPPRRLPRMGYVSAAHSRRPSPAVSSSSSASRATSSITMFSPSTNRSRSESPPTDVPCDREDADPPLQPPSRRMHRISSLRSLLANSLTTRTDLRAERRSSQLVHPTWTPKATGTNNRTAVRRPEFRSLLADSQSRRMDLRSERRASAQSAGRERLRREGDEASMNGKSIKRRRSSGMSAPSDDLLDLFAYDD